MTFSTERRLTTIRAFPCLSAQPRGIQRLWGSAAFRAHARAASVCSAGLGSHAFFYVEAEEWQVSSRDARRDVPLETGAACRIEPGSIRVTPNHHPVKTRFLRRGASVLEEGGAHATTHSPWIHEKVVELNVAMTITASHEGVEAAYLAVFLEHVRPARDDVRRRQGQFLAEDRHLLRRVGPVGLRPQCKRRNCLCLFCESRANHVRYGPAGPKTQLAGSPSSRFGCSKSRRW